jgi:hypothetical protein
MNEVSLYANYTETERIFPHLRRCKRHHGMNSSSPMHLITVVLQLWTL